MHILEGDRAIGDDEILRVRLVLHLLLDFQHFDADAFAYVPDSAEVRKVASLRYELTPVEVVLTPGDDDTLIRS